MRAPLRSLRTAAAIGAVVTTLLASGCGTGASGTGTPASAPAGAPAGAASAATASPGPTGVIDVASLPLGRPARAAYLADGELHWHGRATTTDFPTDALYVRILGAVDGRPVVTAYQGPGARAGDRFWSIDPQGRARRIGGTYHSYDYLPELVASTGHLWIHYEDRSTPRTIWELDVRTGRQLAAYPHNEVPSGLARADQALVDAWVHRRTPVPDSSATSPDGSLVATTRSSDLGTAGSFGDEVVVRQTSDRSAVARFTFPEGETGGVDRVVFEGGAHVLVLTTVSATRRGGPQQAIVRCSLRDQSCQRTTGVGGSMALGVDGPSFPTGR